MSHPDRGDDRTSRNRQISRAADLGRIGSSRPRDPGRFIGQVIKVNVDPAKGKYVLVQPADVDFVEAEGQPVAFKPYGVPVPVAVLNGSPVVGDYLICTAASGGRWISERSAPTSAPGGDLVTLPTCSCRVPKTLKMTSRSTSCNFGMFQSCTLQYGPAPALMAAFGLRDAMFTSPEQFLDPISQCYFFYYWECYYNQFFLTRIFPVSPISSPFRDGILYAWVVGGYRNTCSPFYLYNGTAFPGSDASCSISVEGA